MIWCGRRRGWNNPLAGFVQLVRQDQCGKQQLAHFGMSPAHGLDFRVDQTAEAGDMVFFSCGAGYRIGTTTNLQRDIAHCLSLRAFDEQIELPQCFLDGADKLGVPGLQFRQFASVRCRPGATCRGLDPGQCLFDPRERAVAAVLAHAGWLAQTCYRAKPWLLHFPHFARTALVPCLDGGACLRKGDHAPNRGTFLLFFRSPNR